MKPLRWPYVKALTGAWPVQFGPRDEFTIIPTRFDALKTWRVFWEDMPEAWMALRRIEREDWLGKRHQVRSIARAGAFGSFVVAHRLKNGRNRFVDGNHRVLAAILAKWRGPVLVLMAKP